MTRRASRRAWTFTTSRVVNTDPSSRCAWRNLLGHPARNYDLPKLPEDFIHRIGRSGRAGARGRASSLESGADSIELRSLERARKLRIERKRVTGGGVPVNRCRNSLVTRTLVAMPGEQFA